MKLDSKYFDCIRVRPAGDRHAAERFPPCEWEGCGKPGPHPAPRGRGREGQYFNFCLDHVRQYNKSYNYFAGMTDAEVARFQKETVTGNRPTWSMGVRSGGSNGHRPDGRRTGFIRSFVLRDGFGLFGGDTGEETAHEARPQRPIRNAERKCLRSLGLDETATRDDIKASFKALVKLHHPDSNGGDRRTEDKLRDVIQAYNYLKQAGLC